MTNDRVIPTVVVTHPTPAIAGGKPSLPAFWAQLPSSVTAIQGAAQTVSEQTLSGTENVMTAGSNLVTAARRHPFTSAMVGQGIIVGGAGPAGVELQGYIGSYISSSQVRIVNAGDWDPSPVNINASTTVTATTSHAVIIDILVGHICAIPNPDPKGNSDLWTYPPPKVGGSTAHGAGHARWTVADLPDPSGSFYWLGDPSGADGTLGSSSATHQWAANGSSVGGSPSWRSFYPFKPSVAAVDHYLQGGGVVHHPKGVNFNPHFIEHMWLDWGADQPQPFTWAIAMCVANYPTPSYIHTVLDMGRNPDAVRFPRISADACNTPRLINDGQHYRNMIQLSSSQMLVTAHEGSAGALQRTRFVGNLRPKMVFAVFNGANSYLGSHDPSGRIIHKGALDHGPLQHHRYYVLGRAHGHMSQAYASHMLVFEMRFWHQALTPAELAAQYNQLSSTWQFDKYRGV